MYPAADGQPYPFLVPAVFFQDSVHEPVDVLQYLVVFRYCLLPRCVEGHISWNLLDVVSQLYFN